MTGPPGLVRLITREVAQAWRGGLWLPVIFFLLIATLVPFAVGPDEALLRRIAPGLLWIAALCAALLPIDRLIEPDRADGWIDQWSLGGLSMEMVALAKIIGHWLGFGPLLIAAAALGGILFGLEDQLGRLIGPLAIGTLALAALGVSCAALTAGLARSSGVAPLLMLPLAIPLLIFGASASGGGGGGALQLAAATALVILVGAPLVTAAALRAGRS